MVISRCILIPLIFFLVLVTFCRPQKDPVLARDHNLQGLEFYNSGNYPAAEQDFENATKFDPSESEYWNNLGMSRMQMSRAGDASSAFKNALRLKPSVALYHFNLGLARMADNKIEKGFQAFQKAATIDPEYSEALFQAGSAALLLGQKEKAIEYFEKSLKIKENPLVLTRLGAVYLKEINFSESERLFQRALQLDPKFALAAYNLGVLKQKQNDLPAAQVFYSRAVANNPTDYYSLYNLALLQIKTGQKAEAIENLKLFTVRAPSRMTVELADARKRLESLGVKP